MILYNITVNIENDVEEDWLGWMKNTHLPAIMSTNLFLNNKMYRIMNEEAQGTSYSIQLFAQSMAKVEQFESEFAMKLQMDAITRYGSKLVEFRTKLQSVN
ncbi:MAG: DUF4286 family protein [Cyclobacteriaceae bacterium]